jgi:hypothetical protein
MRPLIVVSSVIANKPFNGGNARMVLNWLQGLQRLGADVFFIEQIRSRDCVDANGAPVSVSGSVNRAYFDHVLGAAAATAGSALIEVAGDTLEGARVHGATPAELLDLASDADLLINISGHLSIEALKNRFRRKVYVDLDPGYTQLWHAEGSGAARLENHDVYFTVGQRIGAPGCTVPTGGLAWRAIRQPIVLDGCSVTSSSVSDGFTTIASWRGAYAPMAVDGVTFGSKAHEFRKIVNLPRLSPYSFQIALDIHPADVKDLNALRGSGWGVVDAVDATATPEDYCSYIERSAAECSAAQGMYTQTRSGWFSDRTARYLASGKPVLIQDTGFVTPAHTGEGVIVFKTPDEAVQGAECIARDYRGHSEAARFIAERDFDSNRQLGQLLDDAAIA